MMSGIVVAMQRSPLFILVAEVWSSLWAAVGGRLLNSSGRTYTNVRQRPFTVTVEGNIASGKTTFLSNFKANSHTKIYDEPVNRWRNIRGENALEYMYKDPKRWSMSLQTYVQLTMLTNHVARQEEPVKMMERSIQSARYCFVENLYNTGKMGALDYNILVEWYNWIESNQDVHSDLIIYLKTKPEVLQDRILKRSRNEERSIPLEYLQQLDRLHDEWLLEKKFGLNTPVMVIDANQDGWITKKEVNRVLEEITKCAATT